MKFNWKKLLTKIIPLALLVGIVLVLLPTHFAHAYSTGQCFTFGSGFSLGACISGGFYWIIYLLSSLFGIGFAFILWMIGIILQFNMNIVNTTFVQTGFSVTLGLANLGFVLGIIIVALATILRRETYGIKSILWKLVIMAILVNFALVIAAPIIGFGNNLTLFFMKGMSSSSSSINPFDNLASGIAGTFQPQRLIAPENASTTVGSVTQTAVGPLGTTLGGIIGLIMALIALVAIFIVLVVLFIMLIIRYVYLEVLLIVAPLAWMAWIFPGTSKHFSKWWDRFIKQVFFPAIAMFFIYLVLAVGGNISAGQNVVVAPSSSSWLGGFLQALGYGILGPQIGTFINTAVMIGLMMAGLTMASALSTEGSKLAAQAVAQVRKEVTGYATKRGLKAGRYTAKKVGANKLLDRVRMGQFGQGKLKNVPLVGAAARALQTGAATVARNVQENQMTNMDLVEDAKKNVPKDSAMVEKDLRAGNLSTEQTFAHLQQRLKDKLLKLDEDKIGPQTVREWLRNHKEDVKAYGQGKFKYDAGILVGDTSNTEEADDVIAKEKARGADDATAASAAVTVQKDIKDALGMVVYAAGSTQKASDVLAASYREMAQSWTKDIAGKADINQMSPEKMKQMIGAFAIYAPGLIGPLLKGARSPALTKVELIYKDAIKEKGALIPDELEIEKKAIADSTTLSDIQKEESIKQMEDLAKFVGEKMSKKDNEKGSPIKSIDDSLAANVMFFGSQEFESRKDDTPKPPPAPKP